MTNDAYGRPKLPYPYSYTLKDVFETSFSFQQGDMSNVSTDDCNFYVVALTQEQERKFTSALLAGFDLIYPETYVPDMEPWLQSRELVNTFNYNGGQCMDLTTFCQKVLECIQNDTDVQDGIREIIREIVPTDNAPSDEQTSEVLQSLDCAWGACVALTDWMQETIDEYLNVAESAQEGIEAVTELVGAIPYIGKALEFGAEIFDAALDVGIPLIRANNTNLFWQNRACELFCLIRDAGTPYVCTLPIMTTWVDTSFPPTVSTDPLNFLKGFVGSLIRGSTLAGLIVDSPWWSYGALFSLFNTYSDDDCNNNWQTFCTDCPTLPCTITESFDTLPPALTLIDGTWSSTGGNPDGCLYANNYTAGSGARGKRLVFTYNIEDCNCSQISADIYQDYVGGGQTLGTPRIVYQVFDSNDNLLVEGDFTRVPNNEPDGWYTRVRGWLPVEGSYIRVIVQATSLAYQFNNVDIRLDNLTIT